MGLDSDDPRSLGEVGRLGVAVDMLEDMRLLYDGIDLSQVSVSMTINAPAIIILAFYLANARDQGIDWGINSADAGAVRGFCAGDRGCGQVSEFGGDCALSRGADFHAGGC